MRHSNVMLASSLKLTFTGLSEAQMLNILAHYKAQLGGFYSFDLPSAIWSGVSTVSDYSLTGYLWRYTEPPSVEDLPCGGHNLELSLETVPPENAVATGLDSSGSGLAAALISWNLAPGAATASASVSGLNDTITWSFANERVAAGLTATITWTIASAGATGDSDDYYSNLATQVYSPMRDWSMDWWGD